MSVFADPLETAFVTAVMSLGISVALVATQKWHAHASLDNQLSGAQKFHTTPVPRIGGIAIYLSILIASLTVATAEISHAGRSMPTEILLLMVAGAPAFFAGLVEDLSKNVSIRSRLLATFASALLASYFLDATLPRLDIWGADELLQMAPMVFVATVALVTTAIAVGGMANAVNIIDGFNGLAATTVAVMFSALGFLAWQQSDDLVTVLAALGAGASFGFILVNYPSGKIFLGDGGAYFLGFWLAELAVLLVVRNPSVTTWQVLAICAYPVIETLYSIYRKKIVRGMSPGVPDRLHLHMLIFRRIAGKFIRPNDVRPWIRNAVVAPLIVNFVAGFAILSLTVGTTSLGAAGVIALEVWLYLVVYERTVTGKWRFNRLRLRAGKGKAVEGEARSARRMP